MPDSAAFERACETIEGETTLDRLEARGTIRIVLKQAGLDAKLVSADELRIVAEKLLAKELADRGVESPEAVLSVLDAALLRIPKSEAAESPEDVFARLGGRS